MTPHTYRCMAFCSENCLPNKQNTYKTHCCKSLKTYNKCDDCNIYVCKECSIQLKLHKFTKCVTCRKEINELDEIKDLENLNIVNQDDTINHIRHNNYSTQLTCCKSTTDALTNCCQTITDALTNCCQTITDALTNCCQTITDALTNCCETISAIDDEFKICYSLLNVIKIIIIPILCSTLFLIIFTFNTFKEIVLNGEIRDFEELMLLLAMSWLFGVILIVFTFAIICNCKTKCINDMPS
jgi:hypothetical protein